LTEFTIVLTLFFLPVVGVVLVQLFRNAGKEKTRD